MDSNQEFIDDIQYEWIQILDDNKNKILEALRSTKLQINYKIAPVNIFIPITQFNYEEQNEKKVVCIEVGETVGLNLDSFDVEELLYNLKVNSLAIKVNYN